MKIYENVRTYIKNKGLNQSAVAKKAGIPNATFTAIMNGKRTMDVADLRAICLALNEKPEKFM